MKKISYLLASAVSALAALTASAATAKTTGPELRADQSTTRGSTSTAGTIRVSQAAKSQVGAQATPTKPAKPDVPKATKTDIKKPGSQKSVFVQDFDQTKEPKTNPAGNVKGSFQKNKFQQKQTQ